jgi:hypothetical protein
LENVTAGIAIIPLKKVDGREARAGRKCSYRLLIMSITHIASTNHRKMAFSTHKAFTKNNKEENMALLLIID